MHNLLILLLYTHAYFCTGMARFINNCFKPNAYARVITTEGNKKHIIICAAKSIQVVIYMLILYLYMLSIWKFIAKLYLFTHFYTSMHDTDTNTTSSASIGRRGGYLRL